MNINTIATVCINVLVDGGWSMWGNWSSCSGTCGIATKTRIRTCSQPAPQNGGAQCPGNHTQIHACFDRSCPGNFISVLFFSIYRLRSN